MVFWASSSSRRVRRMMAAAPTSGRNTARVSPHESTTLIGPLSGSLSGSRSPSQGEDHQREREQPDAGEQVEGVLLDPPRLDQAQRAARLAGSGTDAVDGAV